MAHLVMTLQAEGGIIAIEVCDRGPGIAPEDVERLLRPSRAAKRRGVSGAGLGLAIVERLLKHVGGSLRMLPARGGLTARIELPKAKFRNYQLDSENQ